MKALYGTKLGMIQISDPDGRVIPVTLIHTGINKVTQLKTLEKDGYSAVQIGHGSKTNQSKSVKGHLKTSKSQSATLKEIRLDADSDAELGADLTVEIFSVGDTVKVSAQSKGKGFAGTIKRHNFNAGPKSHGTDNIRKPGSIGSMFPQRIWPGKRMAGQMGKHMATTRNLEICLIDVEKQLLGIKGPVPGARQALVRVEAI